MDLSRNSKFGDPTSQEPKQIKAVTSGVTRRPQSLGKRFYETFVGGDNARGVFDYILFEVVIPAAKDMTSDAFGQMVDRFLYGDSSRSSSRRGSRPGGGTYVSYNRFSSGPSYRREEDRPPTGSRARNDFDDLVFPTRAEALEILDQMNEVIERYGAVTQADVLEMATLPPQPIDHKWGWTDLSGARVVKVREGHMIQIPKKPESIN